MGSVGTDRFLNNVVKRSYKDVMVNPLVLLLIFPGCFGFTIYVVWTLVESWHLPVSAFIAPATIFTAVGFVAILALAVVFYMVRAISLHHSRDTDWMYALLGYAAHNGKDVTELEELCDEMAGLVGKRYERFALVVFLLFSICFTFQGLFTEIAISDYPEDITYSIANTIVASVIIIVAVTLLHNLAAIYMMDSIQCRFTKVFSELMSDDTEVVTMKATARISDIKKHIILLVVTLGAYSALLGVMYVHTMNKHIRSQWDYEVRLLNWMSAREGAEGIVKRKSAVSKSGLTAILMRIF